MSGRGLEQRERGKARRRGMDLIERLDNPLQAGFDAARAAASSPIIWREYDKDAGSLVLLAFCTVCATVVTFQRMSDR